MKVTGKYLGSISEEKGLISSKSEIQIDMNKLPIKHKVFGSFILFNDLVNLWLEPLKKYFPKYWQQIMCMVYARLFKHSPIKDMQFFFDKSMYSML